MKILTQGIHFLALVSSLALFGCSGDETKISAEFNQGSSLVGELPANPLQWRIISSAIDSTNSTMSTLFGNDIAIDYARTNVLHDYPPGAVLAFVTWTQSEDGRWFGAKIPAQVKSVEFATVTETTQGRRSYSYRKFEGMPLKQSSVEEGTVPTGRAAFLLSQRSSVMP